LVFSGYVAIDGIIIIIIIIIKLIIGERHGGNGLTRLEKNRYSVFLNAATILWVP
jgi:hypothetical protein